MAIVEFSPTSARCGWIKYDSGDPGDGLTAYPDAVPYVGQDPNPTPPGDTIERRGFLSYDTSALPAGITITSVRLYMSLGDALTPIGQPSDWRFRWLMGEFIGSQVDTGDWDAGTSVRLYDWPGDPGNAWITFTSNLDLVNLTGYTDIKIVDESIHEGYTSEWWTSWRRGSSAKLEVTYNQVAAWYNTT